MNRERDSLFLKIKASMRGHPAVSVDPVIWLDPGQQGSMVQVTEADLKGI